MKNRIRHLVEGTVSEDIPESKYRQHLRRAKALSNYFMFLRAYTKLISKLEALFLQDLINREEMVVLKQAVRDKIKSKRKQRMVDDDDYFRCSTAFMENERYLVWSVDEQRRLFKLLEDKGYIKTKRKGMPQRRWVWINYPYIESQLDSLLK